MSESPNGSREPQVGDQVRIVKCFSPSPDKEGLTGTVTDKYYPKPNQLLWWVELENGNKVWASEVELIEE